MERSARPLIVAVLTVCTCVGLYDCKGSKGAPGASCWDLNGNAECDPGTEDLNGDGECGVLDCAPGPGVSCWDLDGDGECTPATEDVDGDGDCTVADCSGPAGGTCWDLDESGTCETATEDLDLDGVCDTADCFGLPGQSCWDLDGDAICDVADEDRDASGACDALDCVGDPGERCWDLDADGTCDAAAEDLDVNGVCDVADCRPIDDIVIGPAHNWGTDCLRCHTDWNLVASHDSSSPRYNPGCITCHGNMLWQVTLDAAVPPAHEIMMQWVFPLTLDTEVTNGTCAHCHESVDFLGGSAASLRKQVDVEGCAACHSPTGPGLELYVE